LGSAKNIDKRWGVHVGLLLNNKHFNRHLQHAWQKYGAEAFSYEITELLGPYDKAFYFAIENEHIDRLRSEGIILFNIARAEGGWGEDTMLRRSEIIEKISAGVKVALANPEVKKKMRNAKLGIPRTAEEKRKTSDGLKGITRSAETRAKMAAAQKIMLEDPKRRTAMAEVGKMNVGRTPVNAVQYTVNGITYKSGCAALRQLGITSKQLAKMVKNGTAKRQEKAI